MTEYQKAMLLLQKAQVELLTRIAYQNSRSFADGSEINAIITSMDREIGQQCPSTVAVLRNPV